MKEDKKISRKNAAMVTTSIGIQILPILQQWGLAVTHIQLNALLMPVIWYVFIQRKIDQVQPKGQGEFKNKFFQLPFVTTIAFAIITLLQIVFKKDMDSQSTEILIAGISTVTVTIIGIVTRWRSKN